jgi:hypothetical protein
MGGVTLDLLHRIRWANVARAAAVVLALLLALAWPRLRAHQDGLPPAVEPVPAAPTKAATAMKAARVAQPARVKRAKAPHEKTPAHRARATVVPKRQAGKRRAARHHRHARHRRPRIAIPAPAPAPAYVAPAAVSAPAAEFRP